MNKQAQALKQIALDRYDVDGGTLYECSDAADYEALIAQHGTAEAAWNAHLDIHCIRREIQAGYDADDESIDDAAVVVVQECMTEEELEGAEEAWAECGGYAAGLSRPVLRRQSFIDVEMHEDVPF